MRMKLRAALAHVRHHPGRNAALALAIGLAATLFGAALGARSILDREVPRCFASAAPPAIVVHLDDAEAALDLVADVPGVRAVDAGRIVRARARVAPGDWCALRIFVVRDFADMRVARISPTEGAWPPPGGALLVERSGVSVLRAGTGDTLTVRTPSGEAALPIAGQVHDPAQAPGWQDDVGYAYASPAVLDQLGLGGTLNELRLTTLDDHDPVEVAAAVRARLDVAGMTVRLVEVLPRVHPHADHMAAMMLLLTVFSALALLLAGALAGNLIAATVARETRQIGVLRALGASRRSVSAIYLAMVAVVALGAAVPAIPLSALIAQRFARFAGTQLNLSLTDLSVGPAVWLATIGAAVLVPLIAAAVPMTRALRTTPREAIRGGDVAAPSHAMWLSGFAMLDRLSLRNSTRRPARAALTLLALAVGGAMMLTAANLYGALDRAVDGALAARGDDLEVRLLRSASPEALVDAMADVPGIESMTAWPAARVGLEPLDSEPSGIVSGRYGLLAPPDARPPGAVLFTGRWPDPAAEPEVIVNRQLAGLEPALAPGRRVRLYRGGAQLDAMVVGVVEELAPPGLYIAPRHAAEIAPGAGALRLVTAGDASAVAGRLEDALVARGHFPVYSMTRGALREALVDHFAILVTVLSAIALAALLVGALGLATMLALNVFDRTRELGVLRAIGADDRAIRRLVLVEGMALAGLALLAAIVLSWPLTWAMARGLGPHTLRIALPFTVSPVAIGGWALAALLIGWLACRWPAGLAIKQTARRLLAHT